MIYFPNLMKRLDLHNLLFLFLKLQIELLNKVVLMYIAVNPQKFPEDFSIIRPIFVICQNITTIQRFILKHRYLFSISSISKLFPV